MMEPSDQATSPQPSRPRGHNRKPANHDTSPSKGRRKANRQVEAKDDRGTAHGGSMPVGDLRRSAEKPPSIQNHSPHPRIVVEPIDLDQIAATGKKGRRRGVTSPPETSPDTSSRSVRTERPKKKEPHHVKVLSTGPTMGSGPSRSKSEMNFPTVPPLTTLSAGKSHDSIFETSKTSRDNGKAKSPRNGAPSSGKRSRKSSASSAPPVNKSPIESPTGDRSITKVMPQFMQAMVLHPERKPEHLWQQILNNNLANNSSSIWNALIKLTVVNATPMSANGLFLVVSKRRTSGIEQLFSTLQDEKTKEVLRHNAVYKSFWYGKQMKTVSKADTMQVAQEATGDRLALVSYVPKIVVRRFVNEPGRPVRAPEVETYFACVLFADISGFTPLTESLNTLGAEGVERLTTHLNEYFSQMIKLITDHGGDIVKFAGDALMVVWPTNSEEGLYVNSLLACQCATALQKRMGRYQVGEAVLQLHVGMGAGKVTGIHVGGVQGRLEFFIAGHPIEQLSSCEEQALPGQVFISPELHKIVKKHAIGEYVLTNFRLDAIAHPLALPALKELPLITQLETRLKSYVPQAVLSHLDTHEYLAELRTVSVIFVNLHVTYVDDVESPKTIQLSVAAMQAILGRFEGTVRQFLVDDKGSVLIAAFGLPPLSHEDDPLRAVDAALEMQKLLVSLKITPSIGITTGRAFCGAVGSETRREYALVGDVVNLSARLMSASKNFGGILCDETTANAARSSILFKDLAPINVKGKKNPIPVFAPLSKVAAPIGPSGQPLSPLTQEPTKVIGRQKIMAIADYRLKQLKPKAQEPGHVLILEGEAGIGKSRVLQEMRALVDPECEVFVGAGDLTAGTQTYYGSWAFIFNAALDLGSITDDNLVQPHIEGILGQISKNYPLPDLVPDWLSLAPLLNSILPLGIPENKVTSSMPDQSRAEVFQLLLIRLLQTTIDPGSVIILEDAHYFDSNSWTLTLAVAQQLRGVLIVLSLRPMKPPLPFAYQQIMHCGNASNVVLTALNAQESVALAKQFLGVTKLPDALATQIVEKGQGNPFIIEELTDALKSDGIVLVQNGECKLKPGATLQLPSTVRQLITAKFDKLTSSQKSILKVASVIGKVFDVALLIQLLPGSATKSEVQADLSVLEKTSFITPENADTTSQPTGDTPNSTPRKVLTTPDSARSFDSRVSPPASPTTKRKQAKEREAHFADEPLRSPRLMESTPANTNAPLSPSRPEEKTPKPPARTSPKKGRREKDKGKEKDDKDKEQDKEKGKDKKPTENSPSDARKPRPGRANRPTKEPKEKLVPAAVPVSQSGVPDSVPVSGHESDGNSSASASGALRTRVALRPRQYLSLRSAQAMQAAALTTGTERSDESARRYRSLSRKFSAIRTRGGTLRLRAGSFNTSDEDTTEPSVTPRSLETIVHITEPEQDELLLKEYSFKNETIMEVVYSMMLFSQRRQLHASIARWYETNHAQNLSAFAAILGYHWKLSEQNLKQASKYYIQAGEQALRSFSNQEAVTFFLEALQVETKSMKPKSKVSIPSTLRKSFIPNPVDEDDLFGLLHLYRKLGQAYYNLGNFAQSNKHLQQALKVVKINAASFGESIPVKPDDRLLKDLSTLMAADAYVKREVVLALLTMARVNYYSCNRRASAYCNIVALTLTIRADFWAEQSEAYAQCIVSVGLAGAHQLAGAYVDMGHKLTSGKLDLSSHVHQNAGLYYSSRAVWKKSEFAFKASIDMAQKTGDRRRFEEGNIFLALNHYLQGQFRKSLLASTKSLDSARLRGDIQCQILALSSQVCCHLTLGNILKAASKLDQIRVAINRDRADNFVKQSSRSSLLETTGPKTPKKSGTPRQSLASGDVASDINYFALMGILSLFKNEPAEALRMANQAEEIFRSKQLEPTAFFTFPGYMSVPEIYLRLLLRPRDWNKIDMSAKKLIKRFNKSMHFLRQFAASFTFAQPRVNLLEGLGLLAQGQHLDVVAPLWKSGYAQAKELHMVSEASIIEKHLASDASMSGDTLASSVLFSLTGEAEDIATTKRKKMLSRRPLDEIPPIPIAERLDYDDTMPTSASSAYDMASPASNGLIEKPEVSTPSKSRKPKTGDQTQKLKRCRGQASPKTPKSDEAVVKTDHADAPSTEHDDLDAELADAVQLIAPGNNESTATQLKDSEGSKNNATKDCSVDEDEASTEKGTKSMSSSSSISSATSSSGATAGSLDPAPKKEKEAVVVTTARETDPSPERETSPKFNETKHAKNHNDAEANKHRSAKLEKNQKTTKIQAT